MDKNNEDDPEYIESAEDIPVIEKLQEQADKELEQLIDSSEFIQSDTVFAETMLELMEKLSADKEQDKNNSSKIHKPSAQRIKAFYKYLDQKFIKKNDHYKFLTEQSKNNFKKFLKNFAIYEVYKAQNPKRIAGETRFDNFANNILLRGGRSATMYDGGYAYEIEDNIKKLTKKIKSSGPGIESSFKEKILNEAKKIKNKQNGRAL